MDLDMTRSHNRSWYNRAALVTFFINFLSRFTIVYNIFHYTMHYDLNHSKFIYWRQKYSY